MPSKWPVYGILLANLLILKAALSVADARALWPLLYPVQAVLGWVSGTAAVGGPSGDYYFPELHIWIDKSCAGGNFFIICLTMTLWVLVDGRPVFSFRWWGLLAALLMSYVCNLLANFSRIMIWLLPGDSFWGASSAVEGFWHRAVGVVVYVTFLLAWYWILTFSLKKFVRS